MAKKYYLLLFLVAIGMSVAAVMTTNAYVRSEVDRVAAQYETEQVTQAVLVANMDMLAGDEITLDKLALREIPHSLVSNDAYQPAEVESLIGKKTLFPIRAGTQLLQAYLQTTPINRFSDLIEPGYRAVSLSVDALSSHSGMIKPGDLVDILVIRESGGELTTEVLLTDMQIIAAGTDLDDGIDENIRYAEITVMVPVANVEMLVNARDFSRISLVVKNKADSNQYDNYHQQKQDTSKRTASAESKQKRIEWIIGGSNNALAN